MLLSIVSGINKEIMSERCVKIPFLSKPLTIVFFNSKEKQLHLELLNFAEVVVQNSIHGIKLKNRV